MEIYMRKSLAAALICVFVLTAAFCEAEYGYYYYYPGYGGYYTPYPYFGRALPSNPQQFRIGPNPGKYRRWDQMNRYEDFQRFQQSPLDRLNPEPPLDYMMRTF
jgi:hypothetical protein